MQSKKRFFELDILRAIAIILMIIYHFVWDLHYFNLYNANIFTGFWKIIQIITGSLFIFLVGICLPISTQNQDLRSIATKCLFRGGKIFALGMLITVATLIFLPNQYIFFGILHLIGLSIILAIPFLRFQWTNLILGSIFIIGGNILKHHTFNTTALMWLGFLPPTIQSVDYYPVLPWFGVVLLGIFAANTLYKNNIRQFPFSKEERGEPISKFLQFLGRHSLIIYITHQPILFGLFYLITSF